MKYFLGQRFDEHDRTLWRGTDEVRLTKAGNGAYRFLHPLHTQLPAGNAPVFDHLRAVERLALSRSSAERFG